MKHAKTVVFGTLLFILFFALMQVGLAANWLENFTYRKQHTIIAATGAGSGYPVQIITHWGNKSSCTFGNDNTTGTSKGSAENHLVGSNFTACMNGTAGYISPYLNITGAAHDVKCAIYNKTDSSLVAETEERTLGAANVWAWYNFSFVVRPRLFTWQEYILIVWSESTTGNCWIRYNPEAIPGMFSDAETYNGFPDPAVFLGGAVDYQYAIQCHMINDDYGNEVWLNEKAQADFDDVRFTAADATTELWHWPETTYGAAGVNASWWVRIPQDLSTQNRRIYIYYGNATIGVSSYRNPFSVFDFFDDFNDASLNATSWKEIKSQGSYVEGSGFLRVRGGAAPGQIEQIGGQVLVGPGHAIETVFRMSESFKQFLGFDERSHNGSKDVKADTAVFRYVAPNKNYRTVNDTAPWVQDSVRTTTLTTWTRSYIYWTSPRVRFYDGNIQDNTNIVPSDSGGVFIQARDNANCVVDVNWVLIRNYVDPEPSHGAWGAEETGP